MEKGEHQNGIMNIEMYKGTYKSFLKGGNFKSIIWTWLSCTYVKHSDMEARVYLLYLSLLMDRVAFPLTIDCH